MQDDLENSSCGACFKTKASIVEESFVEDVSAFARYAFLSRHGGSPALCQDNGGTYYVCHICLPGERTAN